MDKDMVRRLILNLCAGGIHGSREFAQRQLVAQVATYPELGVVGVTVIAEGGTAVTKYKVTVEQWNVETQAPPRGQHDT